ncbi:MAG: Uma2 family endonuclease [Chitinophagales bacterium]
MSNQIKTEHLPNYSFSDYKTWTDRWEIISGIPYSMLPLPSLQHQRINKKIVKLLDDQLQHCEKCEAFMPVDWKIDSKTVVQPDALVTCAIEEGNYITQSPALVFEILSPSTAIKDRHVKFDLYYESGVKYYVIISPEDELATIFLWMKDKYQSVLKTHNEVFEFDLGDCKISFDFNTIW